MEDPRQPGFLHNTHAFFQRAITAMPWYADLELERQGAHYIEPELNVRADRRRPRARMVDRYRAHRRIIRAASAADAETLRRWHARIRSDRAKRSSRRKASPPLPAEERRALLSAAPPADACWK